MSAGAAVLLVALVISLLFNWGLIKMALKSEGSTRELAFQIKKLLDSGNEDRALKLLAVVLEPKK